MTLITGTPAGTINTMEDLFLDGAPNIYFQDSGAGELNTPDSDGFYWGLSGTVAKPVMELGCYTDVTFGDNSTITDVRCDAVGDKDALEKRNYQELKFVLKSLFPLATLRYILKGGAVTAGAGLEKMGFGVINNKQFWHVYFPKVYDEATGDYVCVTMHRAKFMGTWTINMPYADQWNVIGITLRGLADTAKPSDQIFSTVIRADPIP